MQSLLLDDDDDDEEEDKEEMNTDSRGLRGGAPSNTSAMNAKIHRQYYGTLSDNEYKLLITPLSPPNANASNSSNSSGYVNVMMEDVLEQQVSIYIYC